MKKLPIIPASFILSSLLIASCSTSQVASVSQDNLYFMASDEKLATEYAVANNNPQTFQSIATITPDEYQQENFSARNVNPEFIAKYQDEVSTEDGEMIYFDEAAPVEDGTPDINVYNNYYSNPSGFNSGFNPALSMNIGFMGGFSPWGMGFYDPFWGPSWGYRPGFSVGIGFGMGFGFGNPFFGPNIGLGWGMPAFGWGYPGYGMGYPGYGWGGYPAYGRPIYVIPGGEYGDRRVVRGARPTRGSSLAGAGYGSASNAALPNTARAQARRSVVRDDASSRRLVSNTNTARTTARDFSSSQNDYYSGTRSRVATNSRNVNSPAMSRNSSTRSRSAMPSSINRTNSRSNYGNYQSPSRGSINNRSASPSYNRNDSRTRSTTPSYNRGGTNTRYNTPSRSNMSTPSRNTYSAPSRSSGGSSTRSSGGSVSRSSGSSSGSRGGGRGN